MSCDQPITFFASAAAKRADEQLRAAAPQMLAALRAVLSDLDEYSPSRPAVLAAIDAATKS